MSWFCPSCTLENALHHKTCAACSFNPSATVAEAYPISPPQPRSNRSLARGILAEVEQRCVTKDCWVGLKRYRQSFTLQAFLEAFKEDAEDAALRNLQACLEEDFIHSVPYFSKLDLTDTTARARVEFFQIGSRFHAPSKHENVRKCSVCEKISVVAKSHNPADELTWNCRHCTYVNEVPKGPNVGLGLLSKGVGKVQDLLLKPRPKEDEMAEVVRAAMQCAVLGGPAERGCAEMPESYDFMAVDKSMRGSEGEVKEGLLTSYAPFVMKYLRNLFGISEDAYCESLFEHALVCKATTGGATGSLFFFSEDRRYVVKSVSKKEAAKLREMLPAMVEYVREHRDTLLPRVFGLYKIAVSTREQDIYYFMVTNNSFSTPLVITEVYDLKGSTSKRFVTSEDQAALKKKTGKLPTLKDLNWKRRIVIGDRALAEKLFRQLEEDTRFLASNNIMDYSLLVGVSMTGEMPEAKAGLGSIYRSMFQKDSGGLRSMTGEVFFVGLIDILQVYNVQKQLERFMKTNVRSALNAMALRKQAQDDLLVEELTCPQCSKAFKQAFSTNAQGTLFQVTCSWCNFAYDYSPEILQKLDKNISSIDPSSYRDRFIAFIKRVVIQTV